MWVCQPAVCYIAAISAAETLSNVNFLFPEDFRFANFDTTLPVHTFSFMFVLFYMLSVILTGVLLSFYPYGNSYRHLVSFRINQDLFIHVKCKSYYAYIMFSKPRYGPRDIYPGNQH